MENLNRISFQHRLGMREEIGNRWPALHKFITSGSEIEAAFFKASRSLEGRLPDIERGSAEEVLDFYNKVVADGRYVDEIVDNPSEVASKLNIRVSEKALNQIQETATVVRGDRMNLAVVAIAVAVTVVIVKGSDPLEQIVIDQSGRIKM